LVIYEKYIDLLPMTKLRRDILKVINGYPDTKLKKENIKHYLIKYGYEDIKDNTLYKNLEFLEKEEFIIGVSFPPMGIPTRPPNFYKIIETRSCSVSASTIIRCSDPMECPDRNCRICANAGITTCWD
jgi:hypothetical protein